jgi:hypothetical protein
MHDCICNLLNPKSSCSSKVQAPTHNINSVHLDASELNERISYEEVRGAVIKLSPVSSKKKRVFTTCTLFSIIIFRMEWPRMHGPRPSSNQSPSRTLPHNAHQTIQHVGEYLSNLLLPRHTVEY